MTATITNGTDTITPDLVLGYEAASESGNVILTDLNGDLVVTLRHDTPRRDRLRLFFETKADAWEARNLLASFVGSWGLAEDDHPEIDMTFVRDGSMRIVLDDATRAFWVVETGYQEVIL